MKDNRNSGEKNHVYVDHWERMTPAERKYEKEHSFSGGDLSTFIIIILVILWIANTLASCGK